MDVDSGLNTLVGPRFECDGPEIGKTGDSGEDLRGGVRLWKNQCLKGGEKGEEGC